MCLVRVIYPTGRVVIGGYTSSPECHNSSKPLPTRHCRSGSPSMPTCICTTVSMAPQALQSALANFSALGLHGPGGTWGDPARADVARTRIRAGARRETAWRLVVRAGGERAHEPDRATRRCCHRNRVWTADSGGRRSGGPGSWHDAGVRRWQIVRRIGGRGAAVGGRDRPALGFRQMDRRPRRACPLSGSGARTAGPLPWRQRWSARQGSAYPN